MHVVGCDVNHSQHMRAGRRVDSTATVDHDDDDSWTAYKARRRAAACLLELNHGTQSLLIEAYDAPLRTYIPRPGKLTAFCQIL